MADQTAAILARIAEGESLIVQGNPGSGKTGLLLAALSQSLEEASGIGWSPVMVLTPDRRRAEDFEARAGSARLGSVSAPGGHRLVRSVNSFAYMVVSQWLVERQESLPRPKLFGGANEDAWFAQWLVDHRDEWAQHLPAAVIESELLRMDLRNVIARIGQAGLSAEQFFELADLADMPLWRLAAQAFAMYAGMGDSPYLPTTQRLDAARIPVIAARTLRMWEHDAESAGVLAPCPVPRLVLVDDLQDCTPPTLDLLHALAEAGAQIVATSCPEQATAAFRGGDATLGSRVAAALNIPVVLLPDTWRAPGGADGGINALAWAVIRWVHPYPAVRQDDAEADDALAVSVTSGDGRRVAYIGDMLRSYRYLHDIPWNRQAVIVRAAGEIELLRRGLRRKGIPLAPGHRALQFSSIPECVALLRLLYPGQSAEADIALELVTSPLVNLDRLELYRFLRRDEGGEGRSLLDWLESPQDLPVGGVGDEVSQGLGRAAGLWNLREVASAESAQRGLWTLWQASGMADTWRRAALYGGWEGEKADERLDAVMALFRRADLWEQQIRAADGTVVPLASEFAKTMLSESVVSDSIADTGVRPPGVEVLTVAQAAGRQWDVVFVTGLQDSEWPAMSRANSLLEFPRLAGIVKEIAGQKDTSLADLFTDRGPLGPIDPIVYRRERRVDEARLLVSAVTRARLHLHLVAVENDEQAVSPFLGYLARQGALLPFRDEEGRPLLTEAPRGLELADFIGGLRYATIDPEASDPERKNAARVLAALSGVGVASANPQNWIGAGPLSTSDPAVVLEDLSMGPSRLETATQCMLRWFLGFIDGDDQRGLLRQEQLDSAGIGLLIHRLAEEYPYGDLKELQAALDELWEQQDLDQENWWVAQQKAELDSMVQTMSRYFARSEGGVQTEIPFRMEIAGATVAGRIDRLEHLSDGSVRIIDIKTGKTPPSQKSMSSHLQLSTYQLALREHAQIAEASLLMVRQPMEKALRIQDPLSDQEASDLHQDIGRLAGKMVGPNYYPTEGAVCDTCAFHSVCPAKDKGRRGIE